MMIIQVDAFEYERFMELAKESHIRAVVDYVEAGIFWVWVSHLKTALRLREIATIESEVR